MSTVIFHTAPAIFTFALPVPSAFDPAYLDYTQRIKDLATHILNTPDNKFPRLQVTAEQPMDVDGNLEDLTWTINLSTQTTV